MALLNRVSNPEAPLLVLGSVPSDALHCLVTTDESYAPYAAVTLASVFLHAQRPVHAHVLTPGLSEQALKGLALIRSRGEHALTVSHAPPELTKFGALSYWAESAAIRIATSELLTCERVIYLDCDVIVRTPLDALFEMPLGQAVIAGVPDIDASDVAASPRLNWLDLPAGDAYLNSGVMLMDLARLREMRFLQRAHDWVTAHGDKRRLPDQCTINAVLAGQKLVVTNRWNFCRVSAGPLKFSERLLSAEPTVFHFNGMTKPWMTKAHPCHRDAWQKYLALTEYSMADVERAPLTTALIAEAMRPLSDVFLAQRQLRASARRN